jgi:hypothetical protein
MLRNPFQCPFAMRRRNIAPDDFRILYGNQGVKFSRDYMHVRRIMVLKVNRQPEATEIFDGRHPPSPRQYIWRDFPYFKINLEIFAGFTTFTPPGS